MSSLLTDPTNHPANGPLTAERITRLIAELQRSLEYQNGGDMAYVIADAIKGLEELLVSREAVPVAWMHDGEDGREYNGCNEFPYGGKGVPLYTAPPAPVSVPAAMEIDDDFDSAFEHGKAVGWNAYRASMLQAEPVSNSDELPLDYLQGHKDGLEWAAQLAEANHPQTGDWLYDDQIDLARAIRKGPDMPTVQGGNSPVIPDGWVMVPVELTPDMRAAWDSAPYTDDDDNDMQAAYRAMIAAAPQWKVK
ncbi:hypothetical protein ACR6L4_001951 [Escherichia coli]